MATVQDRLKDQEPKEEAPKEEPKEEVVEEKEEPKEEIKEEIKEEEPEETKEEKTKKRTKKQFEKLKKSNKDLKKEAIKRQNILDSLTVPPKPEASSYSQSPTTNVVPPKTSYPGLSQQQVKTTFEGLVDTEGYVDTGLLISTLKEQQEATKKAEQRANIAEQRAQRTERAVDDFQRTTVMRQVHDKYPRLDPENEDFDERLWEGVRNEVIGQWTSGKKENVMEATKKWSKILYGEEVEVKKKDKETIARAKDDMKDINALGSKTSTQRASSQDHEQLIRDTQMGKRGALAERLRRAEKQIT